VLPFSSIFLFSKILKHWWSSVNPLTVHPGSQEGCGAYPVDPPPILRNSHSLALSPLGGRTDGYAITTISAGTTQASAAGRITSRSWPHSLVSQPGEQQLPASQTCPELQHVVPQLRNSHSHFPFRQVRPDSQLRPNRSLCNHRTRHRLSPDNLACRRF